MGLILCTPMDSNYLTLKYYGRFMIELEASISHHIELSGMYAIFQYPVVNILPLTNKMIHLTGNTN